MGYCVPLGYLLRPPRLCFVVLLRPPRISSMGYVVPLDIFYGLLRPPRLRFVELLFPLGFTLLGYCGCLGYAL